MAVGGEGTHEQAGPAAPGQARQSWGGVSFGTIVRVVSVAATLAAWEWYGRGIDPIFLSYPTAIMAAVPKMLASGELQAAFLNSAQGLVTGTVLAIVGGVLLGLLMGRYRTMDYLLDVQISALYSTPHVALIPLLVLWFGFGSMAKFVLIFLSAFFPIVINTHSGVRNIGQGLVEVALAEGASERQIFTKIVLPAASPFIMTGIRLAMGRAVVAMVVADMFTAVSGLGGALLSYGAAFATDKLFVVIILLALMGVGLTELVRGLERVLMPWKETERAQ